MAQRHGASWGSPQPKRSTTPSSERSYGSEATATCRTEFARCRRRQSVGPGAAAAGQKPTPVTDGEDRRERGLGLERKAQCLKAEDGQYLHSRYSAASSAAGPLSSYFEDAYKSTGPISD